MSSDITLSSGVRQNLLSLQSTADMMATTQSRLATGKKVNSALDNPTNFFTSQSLNNRASDLSSLLDSMSNGMKTLEAADNGLTSMTKTLESMQSTLRQARQDKSFEKTSFSVDLGSSPAGTETLSLSGGSVGSTAVDIDLTSQQSVLAGGAFTNVDFTNGTNDDGAISFNISVDGGADVAISIDFAKADALAADSGAVTADELAQLINNELDAKNVDATATVNADGKIDLTSDTAADGSVSDVTVSSFTVTNGATGSGLADGSGTATNVEAKTVDTLVASINANTSLDGKVRASNDNGKLRIENLSTSTT